MSFRKSGLRLGLAWLILAVAVPLSAALSVTTPKPTAGQSVVFTLNPLYPISWLDEINWNFGDGHAAKTASYVRTISHVYALPGEYQVLAEYHDTHLGIHGGIIQERTRVMVAEPNRVLTFSPAVPNVGETVTFQAVNFLTPTDIAWNFGDGISIASGGAVQTHAYNADGSYTVQAVDLAGSAQPVTVIVTVVDRRLLTFSPPSPDVGEDVTFQAANFVSPNALFWDFGDGTTIASGGPVQVHVYNATGRFTVSVRDAGSDTTFKTVMVPVINRRTIQAVPAAGGKTGQTIQFTAFFFVDPFILWNFGDGSPPVQGTATQAHVFVKPGIFTVTATDKGGNSPATASLGVSIAAAEGPLAGFDLTVAILHFENGAASQMVPQGTTGLAAFADVKYEGTGTILVEWLVDGQIFRTGAFTATFGGGLTIDSGRVPGLPTAVPGPHTVELRFLKPEASFTLPPLTYTVTARKADMSPVVLSVSPAEVEAGQEYELMLQGKNLLPGTRFDFGKGIGIIGSPSFALGDSVQVKVFIAPTAKSGERKVHAVSLDGSSVGPGKLNVVPARFPKEDVFR